MSLGSVFLLLHTHCFADGGESEKLLGVFSSRALAERYRDTAVELPGFREVPDGFLIDEYALNRPDWTTGYVTVDQDDAEV